MIVEAAVNKSSWTIGITTAFGQPVLGWPTLGFLHIVQRHALGSGVTDIVDEDEMAGARRSVKSRKRIESKVGSPIRICTVTYTRW